MSKIDIDQFNDALARLEASKLQLDAEEKEVEQQIVKSEKIAKDLEQIPG